MLAADSWIEVEVYATHTNETACRFGGEELIQAEAERALRRDGIPVRRERSDLALAVSTISMVVRTREGESLGCAVSMLVEFDYWTGVPPRSAVRVFSAHRLLLYETGAAEVRVRQVVDEYVSVMANRLRLELDANRERQP